MSTEFDRQKDIAAEGQRSAIFHDRRVTDGGIAPIRPEQVFEVSRRQLPSFVLDAWNELIADRWRSTSAHITQNEAITAIMNKASIPCDRKLVFSSGWLDIENIYRAAGWKVTYDKPGYNESYEASFTFEKKPT